MRRKRSVQNRKAAEAGGCKETFKQPNSVSEKGYMTSRAVNCATTCPPRQAFQRGRTHQSAHFMRSYQEEALIIRASKPSPAMHKSIAAKIIRRLCQLDR